MRSNRLAVRLQVTQVWAGAGFHGDAPSSPTLGQAEVLALLLRLEAVVIAAAAAVPEASALVALGVEEPHHGVAPAAALALVLVQEAVVCRGQHSAQRRARACVCGGGCVWLVFTFGPEARSFGLQQHVWICGQKRQQETGS